MNTLHLLWGGFVFGLGFWFSLVCVGIFIAVLVVSWAALKAGAQEEPRIHE